MLGSGHFVGVSGRLCRWHFCCFVLRDFSVVHSAWCCVSNRLPIGTFIFVVVSIAVFVLFDVSHSEEVCFIL